MQLHSYTRRQFGKTLLAVAPVSRLFAHSLVVDRINSTIRGVRMGLQSACFTFSGLALDDIINTMRSVGLAEIDVMSEHVEQYLGAPGVQLPGTGRLGPWARGSSGGAPTTTNGNQTLPGTRSGGPGAARGVDPAAREALRAWRLDVGLDRYRAVAKKFADAGLTFFSYNLSFNDTYSDAEIEKGLEMTKALGTKIITASSPLSVLPRVAPLAERHGVVVALHNHTIGPDDFEKATALSKNIWINLDVGHFFASGYDPVAFIRQHHSRITNLHVKDRQKNQGREMPFGAGDTPLREVLLLVREEKYDFPVCIEYVGPDGPAVELRRCFDYCKSVLLS